MRASTSSARVTSARTKDESSLKALMAAAVSSPSGTRLAETTTAAPCLANANAVARPMPELAPVTRTTRPSNSRAISRSLLRRTRPLTRAHPTEPQAREVARRVKRLIGVAGPLAVRTLVTRRVPSEPGKRLRDCPRLTGRCRSNLDGQVRIGTPFCPRSVVEPDPFVAQRLEGQ